MKRRTMLKVLGGGLSLPAMASKKRSPVARGKGGGLKKLLVIFQRGGSDGLNTLIPDGSNQFPLYRNLRPNIYMDRDVLLDVAGSGFFRMHPALAPINPALQAGNFSFVHAVGYPSTNRSHFEAQSFFETAIPGTGQGAGWLNRYLNTTTGPGLLRGLAVSNNIPLSMSGTVAVPVSTNFGNFEIAVDDALDNTDADAYRAMLGQIFDATPTTGNESLYDTGDKIFQMVSGFADRNSGSYVPENGAIYPNSGLGSRVSHAAQMLKDDPSYLGVEVVTIDQSGYDTHANQVSSATPESGSHANRLNDLASSMGAFYTDMGSTRMDDIVVLVVSEFGRRAYQNNSLGTDHGTASVVMAMGNSITGTHVNGGVDWPGLEEGNLFQGEDLDWRTDFRDIYWEILSSHMGVSDVDLASIIPGHTYNSVGIL